MIASLLAFVGCQNEELVSDNNTDNSGKKVILTANIQGAADSRVALTPDTENGDPIVKVAWREYDEQKPETFFVVGENGQSMFTQVSDTEFSGTLPESYNSGASYYAFYNMELISEFGGNQFTFMQDGTLREQDMMMVALFNEDDTSIEFQHMISILKPTFRVGEDIINNTITHIEMGEIFCCSTTVVIDVRPTAPATTLENDIYLTIPILEKISSSSDSHNFIPGETFNFAVTANGNDYTGSLTIPQMDGWNPEGKLFRATIALTEVPEVNYVWTSGIVASASVEGDGTEESPYLIHSANDLQWMIDRVNDAAPQPSPIDESENSTPQLPYYRLTHDLEIDSEEDAPWTPIGTSSSPFVGYFDGGGHTISGEMHTTTDLVGFFGYNAGSISNLKNTAEVKDCRTLLPASIEYSAIGSIAGYSTGKIINCENSGNVTAPSFFTTTYTGGICGYQYRDNCETIALITECKNSGDVTGVDDDDDATGGIVGRSDGYMEEDSYMPALIMACENAGSVTIGDKIGGICGLAKGPTIIVACLNTGNAGVAGILGGGENYDLNGCCTTQGYIGSNDVDEDLIFACYTFDEKYASKDKYVDYSDREWVDEIVGLWNDEDHIGRVTEMNYFIVCVNDFSLYEYPCNWHWEVGENNIPKLVEGAPLGRAGA